LDTDFQKRIFQSECEELAHCVGQDVDSYAERFHLPDRLEDPYRDAGLMQAQRRNEAPDARPSHSNNHSRSLPH